MDARFLPQPVVPRRAPADLSARSRTPALRIAIDTLARALLAGFGVGLVVMADDAASTVGLIAAGILAIGASLVGWSNEPPDQ